MDAGEFVGELCRMTRAGELDWTVEHYMNGATYEAVNGKDRSVFVKRGFVFLLDGERRHMFSVNTQELEAAIWWWELERRCRR